MNYELDNSPIEFQLDLALFSLGAFIGIAALFFAVGYLWYRKKPQIAVILLTLTLIIGLFAWPLLAIVSAILLTGFIVSSTLRHRGPIRAGVDKDRSAS